MNSGMMGSGKTTVGQILSEILGYSFVDRFVSRVLLITLITLKINLIPFHVLYILSNACSDKLIEEVVGGIAVADIFKLHGEKFFREKEVIK